MKFNFSYGITLTYGQYEPALKLNFICAPLQSAIVQHDVSSYLGCRYEV